MANKDPVLRRLYNREYERRRRRAKGMIPRAEWLAASLARTRPWEAAGVCADTWYRRRRAGTLASLVAKKPALTRKREVADLAAKGLSQRKIAKIVGASVVTVSRDLKRAAQL
jgi:DNA-binding CsgD family transcriptional regulator